MGIWGSGLYSNDIALDVRDTYKGLLSDQMSNEDAYKETIKQCREIIETEEAPLFWFALAETQWRVGRLCPDAKENALKWIEKNGGLEFWEDDPKGGVGWQGTLSKLKEKLESPMPKERKFPKLDQNPWNLYDVYAYQLHGEDMEKRGMAGKYMLLQKIGEDEHGHGKRIIKHMQLHAIDHIFMDRGLIQNHEFWQGKTYEEVAEGVYNCIVDCDSHI